MNDFNSTNPSSQRLLRAWRLQELDADRARHDLCDGSTPFARRAAQRAAERIVRLAVRVAARARKQTPAHVLARLLDEEMI